MRIGILHRTRYVYGAPVGYGLSQVRLTPVNGPGQRVLSWTLSVEGGTVELTRDDQHGNRVALVSFGAPAHEVTLTAEGVIETTDTAGVQGRHGGFAPLWLYRQATDLTRAGNGCRALTRGLIADYPDPVARFHALSARVAEAIAWTPGATHAATTAEEALSLGQGVCQDHAHVFIACARCMGQPARYVSGHMLRSDTPAQEAGHAWAEVYLDTLGWVGFDAPNAVCPDERHVRLAVGMDAVEAAPVSGIFSSVPEPDRDGAEGGERLSVDIVVQSQQ